MKNNIMIVEQYTGVQHCEQCWDLPENDDCHGWEIRVHEGDRLTCHMCQKVVGTTGNYTREEVLDMLGQIYHEMLMQNDDAAFARATTLIKGIEKGEI